VAGVCVSDLRHYLDIDDAPAPARLGCRPDRGRPLAHRVALGQREDVRSHSRRFNSRPWHSCDRRRRSTNARLINAAAAPPPKARAAWPTRDGAIVQLIAGCGTRVSELSALTIVSIDRTGPHPLLRVVVRQLDGTT
jgi:integrase